MKHTKIIFYVCLIAILFFNFVFAEEIERTASVLKEKNTEKTSDLSISKNASEISPAVGKETIQPQQTPSLPGSANYILVTDVLDGFGGQKSDGGCRLSNFAGGQSSPIGPGSSTSYKLYAGFIYPTVVLCGDVNKDGAVQLGDLVYLIAYLFKSGPVPDPYQAGDVNCSGIVELGDIVYLISYLYRGGPPPVC
jgi:hypothetical protein